MALVGAKDGQSVLPGGGRATPPRIDGVRIIELGNILTRSGWIAEVFRTDWNGVTDSPQQVIWVQLNPGAVTDWHAHAGQTDHIVGVGGNIKLALWDGRERSPTKGATDVIRIGAMRPIMVVVPPQVWHGLRNESGVSAGYLSVADRLYEHEKPDNWRLAAGASEIPEIL